MTLTAKGLAPLTRVPDIGLGFVTPSMYSPPGGIIGDGTSRALSTIYGTLAEAQVDYPFITSLTQTLDYASLQKMSNDALGWNGNENADTNAKLNKVMQVPAGNYQIGSSTWLIRNASGMRIDGAGRRATKIIGSGIVFATDGLWYSQITGVDFATTGSPAAVVDIDGNVPGHPYATRGVQSNTFKDILIDGATTATYGFALTRLGNPGGGAQGSENLFLACVFQNTTTASWFSTGFNALQNTFIGGNFQGHQKDGIHIDAGSIYIFSVGFQSTYAYAQLVNDGYDINANFGGVGDRITVIGCRTESLRFYRGAGSQPPILIGNLQSYAGNVTWAATTAYTLNQTTVQTSATLGVKLYRITTAGTSGGTIPTWPDTGTVSDGSAVWTMTDFDVIKLAGGQLIGNKMQVGFVSTNETFDSPTVEITADYKATLDDELILCNNTSDITVTLPVFTGTGSVRRLGKRYTIKKVLTNSSKVTVASSDGGFMDGGTSTAPESVIPGGSRGWITAEMGGGGGFGANHWTIAKSLDPDPRVRRLVPNLGTTLVSGDFALSGGWGTTASVSFPSGNSKDTRGLILVTSAGTGQAANPTVTLTFKDGAWPSNGPFAIVCRGAGSQRTVPVTVNSISSTTLVIRFEGTPVAAETYEIAWIVQG